jgi:hypothetical protein
MGRKHAQLAFDKPVLGVLSTRLPHLGEFGETFVRFVRCIAQRRVSQMSGVTAPGEVRSRLVSVLEDEGEPQR